MDPYPLTKDKQEAERLRVQNLTLWLGMGKRLYQAPLKHPRHVLDVASGTGSWGRSMARRFPGAQVVGLDKDPMYEELSKGVPDNVVPQGLKKPGNYFFLQANMLEPFPFLPATFDYAHARLLGPAVPKDRWGHILFEMLRVTREGGFLEWLESPLPECPGPSFQVLNQAAIDVSLHLLHLYNPSAFLGDWLLATEALEEVHEEVFVIGEGDRSDPHVRKLQTMLARNMFIGYSWSLEPTLLRLGLMTKDEHTRHVSNLLREVEEFGITWTVRVFWGRKKRHLDG